LLIALVGGASRGVRALFADSQQDSLVARGCPADSRIRVFLFVPVPSANKAVSGLGDVQPVLRVDPCDLQSSALRTPHSAFHGRQSHSQGQGCGASAAHLLLTIGGLSEVARVDKELDRLVQGRHGG
jgi:hypothetical protein